MNSRTLIIPDFVPFYIQSYRTLGIPNPFTKSERPWLY